MKKTILLSILGCLFGSIVLAQDWVTFTKSNPEAPIIDLIQTTNQQVEFTVEVCGMFKNDLNAEGENFQRIEILGAGKSMETGEPELPYIRQLIAIPECDDVILTVNIMGQTGFNNYNIYPSPDYEEVQNPDGTVYLQEVFSKYETAYAQNVYFNGMNAEIVSVGYLRGQKYAEVFLYPVQFNPVTQHIEVYTNYEISLEFVNPTSDVNVNTGIFNNVATNTMLNYVDSGIKASINDNVQGSGNVQWVSLTDTAQASTIVADYLIICSEAFFQPDEPESEVLRIANHRAAYNGFDVAILNASTIISDELGFFYEGQNNVPPDLQYKKEQRIRTCVRRIYEGENAQHTYDGKLGYLLLIGDVDENNQGMPSSYDIQYLELLPSDYYFSCLTNENGVYDKIAELYIGRFCVDNNETSGFIELHNIVEKTLYFESEYSFGDWRNNVAYTNGTSYEEPYFPMYYEFIENLLFEEEIAIVNWYSLNGQIFQPTIDMFDEGTPVMMYEGHGEIDSWQDSLNIDALTSNLNNVGVFPYVTSRACKTGWFDNDNDCFGESLTTYAEDKGFVGFLGAVRNHFQSTPPPYITDPPTYIQERVPYAIWHDLSHITGEFILEAKIGLNMFGTAFLYNYFGDPALNIMADGFEVTHNITISENTVISSELSIRSGTTLTLLGGKELYFENNGKLIVDEGASLIIGDNCVVMGNSISQSIVLNGSFTVGSNTIFTSQAGYQWQGLLLNNETESYSFENIVFENCLLSGYSQSLSVIGCDFTNSGIHYSKGNITVENSIMYNANVEITNGIISDPSIVNVLGTTITGYSGKSALLIDSYNKYRIDGCSITENAGHGINIINSGGTVYEKIISNNNITNNGSVNSDAGIQLYNSLQLISMNIYGIVCFDNSNVKIEGPKANEIYEAQLIKDNERNQIYATQNSFPYYFSWNAIIDEDNQESLVYYKTNEIEELDVRNNYWGLNFDPINDLFPYEYYIYEPIWDLSGNIGDETEAESMYNEAHEKINTGDYLSAKSSMQQIIIDYPTSKFAKASIKELFSLEKFVANDFSTLKSYYNSEPNIQNNPNLLKLADYLINSCEIKLENYPTAITWFENVIQNPESIEDSIFSIIDLGYTYFLMENSGLKSIYVGKMPEHIPESKKQFEEKREYLLSLLFMDSKINEKLQQRINSLAAGELLQNIPNPFSGTTQVWYKLRNESYIQLNIYNYTGQIIKSIDEGIKTKGSHCVEFDTNGLKNGIYFYSISINGQTTDSKKMTIIK